MNPYQSPAIDRCTIPRSQSWLICSLILMAWGIVIIAFSRSFGAHGFGFSLYAVACSWFIISQIDIKLLWPLNQFKPTLVECFVVLAICGILHGLSLPAITTNCVGRRQLIGPATTTATQPQSGGVIIDRPSQQPTVCPSRPLPIHNAVITELVASVFHKLVHPMRTLKGANS